MITKFTIVGLLGVSIIICGIATLMKSLIRFCIVRNSSLTGDNVGAIILKFLFICVGVVIFAIGHIANTDETINIVNDKVERGYTVYLNGEEVDVNHLDLREYVIRIDDEKECVLLTTSAYKPTNTTTFVPIMTN